MSEKSTKHSRGRGSVELPSGVHRVVSRGREYWSYHPGRGTANAGKRVRLPNDPQSPEFWAALRGLIGTSGAAPFTFAAVIDEWVKSLERQNITEVTRRKYVNQIAVVRRFLGHHNPSAVKPPVVQKFLAQFNDIPSTGNGLLAVLRTLSNWGIGNGHLEHSLTVGVKGYKTEGGHEPWTEAQCAAAEKHLTGVVRRAYFLARYTGRRGVDVVQLHHGMIEDGKHDARGFRVVPQKTKRHKLEIWCPIEDRLAAEMATWDRLGRYVPTSVHHLKRLLRQQKKHIPELAGVTFHGLRATRVVELRRAGLQPTQIGSVVGMSVPMIERYCRFSNAKENSEAAVAALRRLER
jgi:hypothetical protein